MARPELRRRALEDRAEVCDALWTAGGAAIRLKKPVPGAVPGTEVKLLLCSDGQFRPDVLETREKKAERERLLRSGEFWKRGHV